MVLELREGNWSANDYERITKQLQHVISSDNGIPLHELVIISPKTIPKTTSGKISRSRVKIEYEQNKLSVVYRKSFISNEDPETQAFEIEKQGSSRHGPMSVLTPIDEQEPQTGNEDILLPSQLDHLNTVEMESVMKD